MLDTLVEAGIENVMALRGDPPAGQAKFERTAGGFGFAADLVAFIRKRYGKKLCLGGAGNPEGHLECRDIDQDIRHLKAKVDAGLDFVVTQLFFDNRFYFDFVERARAAGIEVPIIPGVMPILSLDGIKRMTELSAAHLPEELDEQLETRRGDEDAVTDLGVSYATLQCADLLAGGAPGIHFITLNRSPATRAILSALRLMRPWQR